MGRFLRLNARRTHWTMLYAIGVAGIAAITAATCARDRETAQAATNAPIAVETGQMFVTLENKAGAPLVNLEVAIVAVGAQRYTKTLDRLEDGEKRDVSLSDFSSRDGTTFNLRFNRPKNVEVKAVDVADRKYDVVAPWR